MRCIHCGIDISYYSSIEHATMRSNCYDSKNGYHQYVSYCEYYTHNCLRGCYKTLKIKKWNVFGKLAKSKFSKKGVLLNE